ncbi:MAG: AAA family ATPase, partial [Promethearchaeota archaeon]
MKIKLSEFRVRNFRCIDDSDWIRVDDITALMGVNEAGKTALLNALHTLNPGSGNFNIDPYRDFPRDRVAKEFDENCMIAKGRFIISKEYIKEKKLDKKFNLSSENDLILILERRYNNVLYYGFEPQLDTKNHIQELKESLKNARKAINRKPVTEDDSGFTEKIRKSILLDIDGFIKKLDDSYETDKIFIIPTEREELAGEIDSCVRELAQFVEHAENEIEPLLE